MELVIRKYEKNDFSEVSQIINESFNTKCSNLVFDTKQTGFVCLNEDVIVGFFLLTKVFDPIEKNNHYLADYVCVRNEYRQMGIGKEMIDYACIYCKENKASYIQLTSSRFRAAAHKLYAKAGFVMRDSDIFRKVL